MKRFTTILGIAFGCLFLLLLVAVTAVVLFGTVSVSSTSTLRSGRTVMVQSDGWAGISAQDSVDTATLGIGGYVIVVAPKELIVDGQKLASIDASAKSVLINDHKGEITFTADGEPVASLRR